MNKWQKLGLVVGMGTAVVTTSHIINKFIFESATINNYTGKTVKHTYSWKFGNIAYSTYGNYDNPPLLLIHDLKAYSSGYEKNFEFNIGSNDEGKGKIDFEIPEILCVVNVDVGVNGVSVNELKLAVTENANEDITAEKEFADSGQVELMRFPIAIGATGSTISANKNLLTPSTSSNFSSNLRVSGFSN